MWLQDSQSPFARTFCLLYDISATGPRSPGQRGGMLVARIAVGGFQHETNTFAPLKASWADFERADAWPPFVRGPELIEAVEGFNIPIAGAVQTLLALGHEPVPLCWCSAPPSSYVEEEAYEKVAGWIIEDLQAHGPVDAVYLDLHGAM